MVNGFERARNGLRPACYRGAMAELVRGVSVPAFIYGTAWKEDRTEALTSLALAAGFRAIDTANQRKHYYEAGVGAAVTRALRTGMLRRDELFLQTKFTHVRGQDDRLPYDPRAPVRIQVDQSFASSLEHLGTDHVDSYLLHGPSTTTGLLDQDVEAWQAMEAIQQTGRARQLGISNITLEQLEQLHRLARVKPRFVQNRCHASTGWDAQVRAFCRANAIGYQAFSLLTANRRELTQPLIEEIMLRTGRTREQLVFRFAIELGMIPLTGTSSDQHMRADLDALAFALDEGDLRGIESIGTR
ncbi:MAG: putative oxidoreductase [Deltaproteobacteria bacterium]|nr:putative oxidoreductase [Deltaproteobacteria bacterium]